MKLFVLAIGLLAASPTLGQVVQSGPYGYSSGSSSQIGGRPQPTTTLTAAPPAGRAPKIHEIHTTSEREVSGSELDSFALNSPYSAVSKLLPPPGHSC